jgi:hypothetical protein
MNVLPLTIESLVSVLLLFTILYCVRLNEQLKRLKGDESAMRVTIAELITATESAERAIADLKTTVAEADLSLGESLRLADSYTGELQQNVAAGAEILHRLSQISEARTGFPGTEMRPAGFPGTEEVRPPAPIVAPPPPRPKPAAPDAQSIMAAAKAFAERARLRAKTVAA